MPLDLSAIKPGNVIPTDTNQAAAIENLTKHIRALWHHVERLEHAIAVENGVTKIRNGDASIALRHDGTIAIQGKDVAVDASGKLNLKASSDLIMKAAKILQN